MKSTVSRRRFFARSVFVTAGLLAVPRPCFAEASPIVRSGKSRLLLSVAAYSFRDYMKSNTHGRPAGISASELIDMKGFIDFAADHGCVGAELTSYYFPAGVTHDYLIDVKRHAFLRGVVISGSAVGNNFALPDGSELDSQVDYVKTWIDYCVTLGAPHLRVFAGNPQGISQEQAINQCVRSLKTCGDYAGERGIMLGLENHGGMVADASVLERIVKETDHDWVRVNLDTGNFYSAHPYDDMKRLAPYAVNVQFKVMINQVPGGKKPSDYEKVAGILRDANYQGFVALEYEESENPWQAVPGYLSKLKSVLGGA